MKIGNFPEVVDENSGRIVAGFITIITILTILSFSYRTIAYTLIGYLVLGFILRYLYASKYEPIAVLTRKYLVPALKVPKNSTFGAPKRFAQFMGILFSVIGLVFLVLNIPTGFYITLSILAACAFLESFVGFCVGCWFFSVLMKVGIIPQDTCEECNNISLRYRKNHESANI